jgi:hypothetical protein
MVTAMSEADELLAPFNAFETPRSWVLEGPAAGVLNVLKRVGAEMGDKNTRYQVEARTRPDKRPVFNVDLVTGNNEKIDRVANLTIEDIPHNRVHMRVRREDVSESQEVPCARFLTAALAELNYLGFIVGDSSRISYSSAPAATDTEEPFSAAEQARIIGQLNAFEEWIIRENDLNRELVDYLQEQLDYLRNLVPRVDKRTWRNVFSSVLRQIALSIGTDVGRSIALHGWDLLRSFLAKALQPPGDPGGGGAW